MKVICISSEDNEDGGSPRKLSEDTLKKLNDAFSSYLDGTQPDDAIDISSEESLTELVNSGITEKEYTHASHDKEQNYAPDINSTDNERDRSYFSDNDTEHDRPTSADINDNVEDVFSEAFDHVSYQSVDIEIEETESSFEINDKNVYSEMVSDILNKTPKSSKGPQSSKIPETSSLYQKDIFHSKHNDLSEKDKIFSENDQKFVPEEVKRSEKDIDVKDLNKEKTKSARKKETGAEIKEKIKDPKIDRQFFKISSVSEKKKTSMKSDKNISSFPKKNEHKSSLNLSSSGDTFSASRPATDLIKDSSVLEESESKGAGSPLSIAFLYSKDHLLHDPSALSIVTHEKPERIVRAMWYLEKNKLFDGDTCTLIGDFGMADENDLLRVHDESYISFVSSYSDSGGGFLGDSTYMTSDSYDIAKRAAGAAIKAGDLLMDKKFSHSFVLTRPPGHHASSEKYGGFCLFNNAAILARYLQDKRNVGKILILDWDAHAGDGTMEIFYEDPTVMVISLHRDPHNFYPRKGFSTQIGDNAGKGYTMNVEMPAGSGNDEYMLAFDEVVVPLVSRFSPEFIIFSCGFDAYYQEKNVGLSLDSEGYHRMTSKISSVFKGPMVFLLEGGYHDFNGHLCHSVLSSLHGQINPVSDRQQMSSYQQNQQKQIFEETIKKVAESKKNNPLFSLKVS